MIHHADAIEALSHLDQRLDPPGNVLEAARVKDDQAWYREWEADPEAFWERAADELHWFERWQQAMQIDGSSHRWFVGGRTNLSYNCLERNIERGLGDKVALHAECEDQPPRDYSYSEILEQVSRTANVLRGLGVGEGDRVVIYMPLSPEGLFTMQACVRLGAVHSVVYAGMGEGALRHRVEDSGARVLVCADLTYRRGAVVPLKPIVDAALAGLEQVEHVIVWRRDEATTLAPGELDFERELAAAEPACAAVAVDAEHPAFMLYTSGTTGSPKGVVHVHGGYAVGVHLLMTHYFDVGESDTWWSTSDIGWIVGHSYICYGPMMAGATQVIREGAPDYPDAGITWQLVDKYSVTALFTAPTAVRMFMRAGEKALADSDRSTLRLLFCAGEPFNPEAWLWAAKNLAPAGHVVDNYWQTEIASPMIGTFACMQGRPGWAGRAMPGIKLKVVDEAGGRMDDGEGGTLVMEQPVPWMMQTIWQDDERYQSCFSERLGGYVTGDIAVRDNEGYWAVLGRSDDVLNVAGHRIGTADVESSLISHPAVSESAAIGLPDELKGERIKVFVVAVNGYEQGADLSDELRQHVSRELGPIARPSELDFVDTLPKTRSGKIMRRLLRARELGLDEGDTSTLED
jgi:acetyl-CoA synthetase